MVVDLVWGLFFVFLFVGGGILLMIVLCLWLFMVWCYVIDILCGKYDNLDDLGDISYFEVLLIVFVVIIGVGNIGGVVIVII